MFEYFKLQTVKPANNSEPRRPVVEGILLTQQIVNRRLVIDVRHRRRPRHAQLRAADVRQVELGRRPGHLAVRGQLRRYGVHGDGLADHVAAVKGGTVASATRQFRVAKARNGNFVPIKFSSVLMRKWQFLKI